MAIPMKITDEMKKSRKKNVDSIIENVNRHIANAVANGRHECCFACDKDNYAESPFYDEARSRFEEAGYRIEPTGYINGVWQRTENIVW